MTFFEAQPAAAESWSDQSLGFDPSASTFRPRYRPSRKNAMSGDRAASSESNSPMPAPPWSSAAFLLQFAGAWEGDDLEECLRVVRRSRTDAEF